MVLRLLYGNNYSKKTIILYKTDYYLYTVLVIKSPSFLEEKFSGGKKGIAALSSKVHNNRNQKIRPVIYYYPIASIALLILLRAVLKLKFLRSSGAKTSNNSVSIREFISLISSSDLPRFFLYLPKFVSASSSF